MSWPFDPLNPFSFDLVHADFPWHFEVRSDKGALKSPQAQYRTMSMEEIGALPVGDLLAPSGVLFMWCTWPLLAKQTRLPERWGLEIKTGGAWDKKRWGTGYLLRSVCEPFVVATLPGSGFRGSSEANLIHEPRREHSRKPEAVFAMLERVLPNARRLDLFGRQSRDGWSVWGNQSSKFDGAAA